MEKSLECYICGRNYKLQFVLNRHLREVHKVIVLPPGGKLKCPLCKKFSVNRHVALRAHLEETHSIKCERRNMKFSSYELFKMWKSNEENHTCFCYTMKTSAKAIAGKAQRRYLHCHRSGYYQNKSTGERRPKSGGSNRIDSTCPSMMVVTRESSGQIKVNYWKTHVGHEPDVEHTVMARRVRRTSRNGKRKPTNGLVQIRRENEIEGEITANGIEMKTASDIKPGVTTEDLLPLLFRPNSDLDQDSPEVTVQILNDTEVLRHDKDVVSLRSSRNLDNFKLTVLKVTDLGEETIEVSATESSPNKSRVLEGGPHVALAEGCDNAGTRIRGTAATLLETAQQARGVSDKVGNEVLRLMNEAILLLHGVQKVNGLVFDPLC